MPSSSLLPTDLRAWTGRRKVLADILDAVLPERSVAWRVRPDTIELEPLPVGALNDGGLSPLRLLVARHFIPILHICVNQLLATIGDEAYLLRPPGDDVSLPAYRWPALDDDGGLTRRRLEPRGDDQRDPATAGEAGLFEPVELGSKIHAMLWRHRQGPPPDETARREILALLFVLRYWEGSNSGELRLPGTYLRFEELPMHIRDDLDRPVRGEEPLRFEPEGIGPEGGEVRCYPDRRRAAEQTDVNPRWWLHAYQIQRRPHDTQVGGLTSRLWHTRLEVSAAGWELERVLLWERSDHGVELS